jgi:hypothetical protein
MFLLFTLGIELEISTGLPTDVFFFVGRFRLYTITIHAGSFVMIAEEE